MIHDALAASHDRHGTKVGIMFRRARRTLQSLGTWLLTILAWEWLFKYWPNGGGVILLRSLWVTALTYFAAIGVYDLADSESVFSLDGERFLTLVRETLPWAGAIFAGVYASFYSRFASQWLYLSQLYNQIKAVEAAGSTDPEKLAEWQAGFIEDATVVHLAMKPLHRSTIRAWLQKQEVQKKFITHAHGGAKAYSQLLTHLAEHHHGPGKPLSLKLVEALLEHLPDEDRIELHDRERRYLERGTQVPADRVESSAAAP